MERRDFFNCKRVLFNLLPQSFGGYIFIYSELGKGTTFKIYFPEVTEEKEALGEKKKPVLLKGTETILAVDDEPTIRQFVHDTLLHFGYDVILAESGEDALIKAKSAGYEIRFHVGLHG